MIGRGSETDRNFRLSNNIIGHTKIQEEEAKKTFIRQLNWILFTATVALAVGFDTAFFFICAYSPRM